MIGWLGESYLWVKAAHVVFMIFWMAGMFALPRFLVYHQEALVAGDAVDATRWIERETKLRRIILSPSMILAWLFGLMLAANIGLFDADQAGLGWLHAKLLFALILSAYHGWAVGYAKRLAKGEMRFDGRRLRLINEVPALLIILIVIMVIVRPF